MNKDEIEHKLEQANKALTRLENRTEQAVISIRKNIKKLQAQLAEAEKPKLRHGDCSLSRMGEPAVFIGNGREAVAYYEDGHSEPCGEWQNGTYAIDGRGFRFNIFKEMQAQSEPLKEFEMNCDCGGSDKIKITALPGCCDECVYIKINNSNSIHLHGNNLHKLILNLRRMEATLKAK